MELLPPHRSYTLLETSNKIYYENMKHHTLLTCMPTKTLPATYITNFQAVTFIIHQNKKRGKKEETFNPIISSYSGVLKFNYT